MTLASTRCKNGSQFSVPGSPSRSWVGGGFRSEMSLFFVAAFVFLAFAGLFSTLSVAQSNSGTSDAPAKIPVPGPAVAGSTIALRASSTMSVASEMGGAFLNHSKCDADGNLYIPKYARDRPLLGPVVKIDPDGKRSALFDPAAFTQLGLDRAYGFSPASDGGMYQVAQSGVVKPRIYVLHFSSDGSPSSSTLLEADFEVYTFAAFAEGNFLVSGVKRDLQNKTDHGHNFTAVFSADGRELAQLSFQEPQESAIAQTRKANTGEAQKPAPTLDLAEAEAGSDGNLYVMRFSSPALVYVIAPSGKIMKTIKVASALADALPSAFHVSGNQMALSFWNEEKQSQSVVVADAQTGRKIASYADPGGLGPSFACYSANDGVFTFLNLGEGNALEVIRAEVQ
jgi:hypothetical protein